jgi:hypothetical protein
MCRHLRWEVVIALVAWLGPASLAHASGSSDRVGNDRGATSKVTQQSEVKPAKVPSLMVRVTPLMVLAPSDARGVVVVPRHSDNRLLRIILESDDYYRSSDIQLHGADAAQNHLLYWRQLPPGSYRVSVELYGTTGLRDSIQAGTLVR